MTTNEQIEQRIAVLKRMQKAELIRRFPGRLDSGHLKQEPKWSIICGFLEAEFGRKALIAYDARQ
jgi:hypothetical protein